MAYIGNASTPTLVIHNEKDLRCPIEQGEQVFVALKRLGVETEFVRFPDEFHGLSTDRPDRPPHRPAESHPALVRSLPIRSRSSP